MRPNQKKRCDEQSQNAEIPKLLTSSVIQQGKKSDIPIGYFLKIPEGTSM